NSASSNPSPFAAACASTIAASGAGFDPSDIARLGVAFSASKAAITIPVICVYESKALDRRKIFTASPPLSLARFWQRQHLQIPVAAAAADVHARARASAPPFRKRASTEPRPRPAPARSPPRTLR